jgi:hypothetical protein
LLVKIELNSPKGLKGLGQGARLFDNLSTGHIIRNGMSGIIITGTNLMTKSRVITVPTLALFHVIEKLIILDHRLLHLALSGARGIGQG